VTFQAILKKGRGAKMAYLHCHTKDCGWSQDDFYDKWYNPITKILSDIKWLWKPRMIEFDCMFVEIDSIRLQKYTGIKIKFVNNRCFSWKWLLLEIVKDIKIAYKMKWWTYKSYEKDRNTGKAKCPKCGRVNFDID
jgi:hypothetical protein